LAVDGCVINQ